MKKFMDWMENHFVPVATKISSQKHLVAIRDSFIAILPVTMVGSIAVLLNVLFRNIPNDMDFHKLLNLCHHLLILTVLYGSVHLLFFH
ncbi:PTS system N,N'-diacetylchitobiose-specific transporter subunit IIC [Streptobacillus moniliformis]|nr:PTS system N,N'-diacetylchitobiose-specific transporter subunit IIC [Streptobacillus moniliformis]